MQFRFLGTTRSKKGLGTLLWVHKKGTYNNTNVGCKFGTRLGTSKEY